MLATDATNGGVQGSGKAKYGRDTVKHSFSFLSVFFFCLFGFPKWFLVKDAKINREGKAGERSLFCLFFA